MIGPLTPFSLTSLSRPYVRHPFIRSARPFSRVSLAPPLATPHLLRSHRWALAILSSPKYRAKRLAQQLFKANPAGVRVSKKNTLMHRLARVERFVNQQGSASKNERLVSLERLVGSLKSNKANRQDVMQVSVRLDTTRTDLLGRLADGLDGGVSSTEVHTMIEQARSRTAAQLEADIEITHSRLESLAAELHAVQTENDTNHIKLDQECLNRGVLARTSMLGSVNEVVGDAVHEALALQQGTAAQAAAKAELRDYVDMTLEKKADRSDVSKMNERLQAMRSAYDAVVRRNGNDDDNETMETKKFEALKTELQEELAAVADTLKRELLLADQNDQAQMRRDLEMLHRAMISTKNESVKELDEVVSRLGGRIGDLEVEVEGEAGSAQGKAGGSKWKKGLRDLLTEMQGALSKKAYVVH